MQDVSTNDGRTVLFVSHNMGSMRQLCNKGLLLSNGTQNYKGTINDTIDQYLNATITTSDARYISKDNTSAKAVIREVALYDSQKELRKNFLSNEEVSILIHYIVNIDAPNARLVLQIVTANGETAFASTQNIKHKDNKLQVTIPANLLNSTTYYIKLHIGQPNVGLLTIPTEYIGFNIETVGQHGSNIIEKWPGVVAPKLIWNNID